MNKLNPFIILKQSQLQITFPKYFTKENEYHSIIHLAKLICDKIKPITVKK